MTRKLLAVLIGTAFAMTPAVHALAQAKKDAPKAEAKAAPKAKAAGPVKLSDGPRYSGPSGGRVCTWTLGAWSFASSIGF